MATKNFKGFQLVTKAQFEALGTNKDKDTLYFVRTNEAKSDGFLYFNGKKYGTAEDAKAAVLAKFGNLGDKTVEAYVNDKIAEVTTAATTLEEKVSANTEAINTINGIGDGSISKAVSDAKTSLVGSATDGYKTLGDLEGKIKAEVSRAKAAEEANATAAADAKAAADNAQATADGKVASVTVKDGETAIEVDNTTATTPKISLKLDNDGNVKFVQTAKGLKGSVEIPEATVTGVKAGDKFLSLADKLVSADVSITYDAADKKIYLYGKDKDKAHAVSSIDCRDFIKDGMLDSAELVTNPSGQTEGTYIVLTWNTDAGKKAMPINVTSLIDIYTAKPDGGLVLEDKAFSVDTTKIATTKSVEDEVTRAKAAEEANKAGIVKLNATHAKVGGEGADKEDFKTVATEVSEGIAGIAETSKASAEGEADVKVTVTTKSGSVSAVAVDSSVLAGKVSANDAAIKEEAQTARAAEKKNADAIATLNGVDTVEGSVDKKIKDALKKGAVTLEVKDNDAYLGVTSRTGATGTVYTLASKEAAINEAIKKAADAVKVSVTNGTYVKGSVDKAGRVITLSEKVQAVADANANDAEKKGLAEASDVKNYVDQKVSDKNVSATGDTLVSASAADNKVTVGATEALTSAVGKANSAVQSVNGVTGTTVVIKATDIEVGAGVSGQTETATVNAVLADIYSKIGAVKVSSQKKTITVDDTGRIIDVHRQTVTAAQEAGHVALECGNDGALYGVMYYSGDDVDAQ